MRATLAAICKAPVAGRVKTRLCPPCSPEEAAELATELLRDTFAALRATPARRRVAVLDGAPGTWLGPGIEVVSQRGGGLDERLAGLCEDLPGGPLVIVGMDTPQLDSRLLGAAAEALEHAPAAIGAAADGGYWCLALRAPDAALLRGVPMSAPHTADAQRARLRAAGLPPAELPALDDVDDIASARRAAAAAPDSRFAARLRALGLVEPAVATAGTS